MRAHAAFALASLLISGCRSLGPTGVVPPAPVAAPDNVASPEQVRAIAYRSDGSLISVIEKDGCSLRFLPPAVAAEIKLPLRCAYTRLFTASDTIVASDDERSIWLINDKTESRKSIAAMAGSGNFVERAGNGFVWINEGARSAVPANLSSPLPLLDGSALIALERTIEGVRLVRLSTGGEVVAISPSFTEIQSIALDPNSKEVAFSARRQTFDIGIVSTTGSDVSWVGPDASDEVDVTWAPRGNKITYVIKEFGGTTFRTVHIPTGYQVAADFPDMRARAVAWEPKAERYAVIVSSPVTTTHVQTIRYGGEEPSVVIPPAMTFRSVVEPIVLAGVPVSLVSPQAVRYGHKYPLIALKSPTPLSWHPLASLQAEGAGVLIIPEKTIVTEAFWNEVLKLRWVDPDRTFFAFGNSQDVSSENITAVARGRSPFDEAASASALIAVRGRLSASSVK